MHEEPRFSESDLREILEGSPATLLPSEPRRRADGLTLSDLESVAREAGLDASGIAHAAAQVSLRKTGGGPGGASRFRVARSVPGVVRERDLGRLAEAIGDAAGESGARDVALGSLHWRTTRGASHLEVRVTPGERTTALRVQADASAVKGLCFLSSIAGALALGGITGAIVEPASIAAGVGIMAGAAATGVATGWTAWRIHARRLRDRVARVFSAASECAAGLARGERDS